MIFLLVSPIIVLISAAALGMVFSGKKHVQFCISCVASLVSILSSLIIFSLVLEKDVLAMSLGNWPSPYGIILVADRFSAVMLLISNLLGLICIIYSYFDIDENRIRHGFYSLLLALLAGANGVFLTGDLFNLYVWFEVILISTFGLLTLGNEKKQLRGALPYVFINLFSSTLLLISVGSIYGITGSLNIAEISFQMHNSNEHSLIFTVALMFLVSLGIKASIVPLFFGIPISYHNPPSTVTSLFAALLTKSAVYVLVRLFTLIFFNEMDQLRMLLLIIAGFTMILGVLGAAGQGSFKRILSFHIISQTGYMIMGLAFFTAYALAGVALFIVHNILIKSCLFLIEGVINRLFGSSLLKDQGGIYQSHPIISLTFLLSAFSLTGLPPLSGFWGKLILAQSGLEEGETVIVGVSLFVSLITLFSMTKIWVHSFWQSPKIAINKKLGGVLLPIIALCLISFAPALFPGPILEYFIALGEELMRPSLYIQAVRSLGEF